MFAITLGLTLLTVVPQPAPPPRAAPAPLFGLARIDPRGTLILRYPHYQLTTYTTISPPKAEGPQRPIEATLTKIGKETVWRFEPDKLPAFLVGGGAIAPAELRERLRGETPVLLAQNGERPIDFYLDVCRRDLIAFILPKPAGTYPSGDMHNALRHRASPPPRLAFARLDEANLVEITGVTTSIAPERDKDATAESVRLQQSVELRVNPAEIKAYGTRGQELSQREWLSRLREPTKV